ncbi:topoisomerase I interacting factor [Scheffersomyces xylosifermentans]|uniref:topoisomerase I interacting factor n=1 Tax=Scheffersomyces xylosifermentans TaxID=1304137 RepID=UPI00315D2089
MAMSVSDTELENTYYDAADEELQDFIVFDEEEEQRNDKISSKENAVEEYDDSNGSETYEEEQEDRIATMTATLRPNETQTSKLLRAHISVLVSALGGPDHTSNLTPPPYKLGHDALACLKDLKRWIKSVDDKNHSYEVALACADSGLLINDLIVILCQWESQNKKKQDIRNKRITEKIMLASLELLVLLTWSVDLIADSSNNQKLLYYDVKKAQLKYKKAILTYNKGQTLKAVIRLVLPTISKEKLDREPRDNAILRLVLFFFRNILYIEPPSSSISMKNHKSVVVSDNMPEGVSLDDISLNSTIAAFNRNKVLTLLLTISSNIGTEFDKEFLGPTCLECTHLILKGVDPIDILKIKEFRAPTEINNPNNASQPLKSVSTTAGMQLQDLLKQESKRKNGQTQSLSSRHGRFGSLLSIRGSDSTSYVVSGQEALINAEHTMDRLDKSKQWKNRMAFKYDSDEYTTSTGSVYLHDSGASILHEFVESFLAGGCFNNLIESVASIFTGNSESVLQREYEAATFFMTIAWFFQYKREKNLLYASKSKNLHPIQDDDDKLDFGSIGAGLSEINFILLIGYFRDSFTSRNWNSLHVAMICFMELLLISNSVFARERAFDDSENTQDEIDRELAEGIIRKLFSFNDFLNILVHIPQTASKHSPDYLKVTISMVHIMLKSFENFAKEDIKLYIQTKRKMSKRNMPRVNDLDKNTEDSLRDQIEGSDNEDLDKRVSEVTRERQLDFKATEVRFFHTATVSTYIEYLSRYEDLSHEEIKRCLVFFHRLFVIRKDFTGLYRLDFMQILHKLRDFLPIATSIRKSVDEFITYFMKKFKVALERFPNPIEILFPRFEDASLKTYLATGELYIVPEREYKAPATAKKLEFINKFTDDEKFKILVSTLYLHDLQELTNWVIEELDRILAIRLLDKDAIVELIANERNRRYIITNSYLRLMLELIGFDLVFNLSELCELPRYISAEKISRDLESIKKWNAEQPVIFEDNKEPSYFLRSAERDYNYDDGEDDDDEEDESIAFVAEADPSSRRNNGSELDNLDEMERALEGRTHTSSNLKKGQAVRKKSDWKRQKSPKKKSKGSLRPPRSFNVDSDDEKDKQIKSSERVDSADDESDDEEFFQREERLRQLLNASGGIVNAQQLAEFKKTWARLESGGSKETAESVSQAIREVSTISAKTASPSQDDPLGEASETAEDSILFSSQNSILETGGDSQKSDINATAKPKRSRIPDEEDEVDDISYTEGVTNYLSAEEGEDEEEIEEAYTTGPSRKKRLIISDDEDE